MPDRMLGMERPQRFTPSPGAFGRGLTDAPRDRAHVNIAEIDVPAVLAFGISTAGEFGHALLKRTAGGRGKPLGIAA
jgi:hypothetical protein